MIVFDLDCPHGHRFEGWFASSEDYAGQKARGLVVCPQCGSLEVTKAPMAPAVPRKGNQQPEVRQGSRAVPLAGGQPPAHVMRILHGLARMQSELLRSSKWVGEEFAEQSRAMHYGEREAEAIHGRATPQEARELFEEGIPVIPLPFPVAAPDELN